MKPLQAILERIRTAKSTYDTLKLSQVPDQSEILRELSVSYHDLNEHRIEARENWMFHYNEAKGTNAFREKFADHKVPELYLIRRNMEATKILIDTVRSTISAAKSID